MCASFKFKEVVLAVAVMLFLSVAYVSFNRPDCVQVQSPVFGAGVTRLAPVNGTWKLVESTALVRH
jgi:hypothetical protein